jgi:hypothetical protein
LVFFFFLAALAFEFGLMLAQRALSTSRFVQEFFEIGSCKLFALG